jgi:[citrate (pro-3S)-lyase] ligase
MMFTDLFFYPVAQTDKVLLMEDKKDGINRFLNSLTAEETSGKAGCIVMNCNPFTLGHQYLIETASKQCDTLYVFVVSEDKSRFSAEDRIEMVRLGTNHIPNVRVIPTGPYLISSATFPTYFLDNREMASEIQCMLDIEVFINYYVPKFGITSRFVGTEPLSPTTNQYNCALKEHLPPRGVSLSEIPRLEKSDAPISASRVRELIDLGDLTSLKALVPDTTYKYLIYKKLI